MINIKTYLKELGYYTIILVLFIFIMSILNLLGLVSSITSLLLFIFNVITFFIFGIRIGKKTPSKGYIAGLKLSGLFITTLLLINILSSKTITILTIIYYLILVISCILGSMIGINKKSDDYRATNS